MNIKSIIHLGLLAFMAIAVTVFSMQWFMLQNARQECLALEATSAEMVYFTAYCGGTFNGYSAVMRLADLKEMYERTQPAPQ